MCTTTSMAASLAVFDVFWTIFPHTLCWPIIWAIKRFFLRQSVVVAIHTNNSIDPMGMAGIWARHMGHGIVCCLALAGAPRDSEYQHSVQQLCPHWAIAGSSKTSRHIGQMRCSLILIKSSMSIPIIDNFVNSSLNRSIIRLSLQILVGFRWRLTRN